MKTRRKRRKIIRVLVIILVLALLVAAACYTVFIEPTLHEDVWVYKEAVVERGDLKVGVTESGSLSYDVTTQMYDLDLTTEEEDEEDDDDDEETAAYLVVENVYVATGQRIKEGEPVMKFTDASIERLRKKLQATLTEREIALAEAKSEYQLQASSADLVKQASMTEGQYAEVVYNARMTKLQTEIQTYNVKIENLEAEIEELVENIEEANEDLSDIKKEYQQALSDYEYSVNNSKYDQIQDQQKYMNAKDKLDSAQDNIQKMQDQITEKQESIMDYSARIEAAVYKMEINQLDATQTFESSTNVGAVAENEYRSTLEGLQESVDRAAEDVEESTLILDNFNAFVGDGTIYADGSGIVTKVGYEAGDEMEQAGVMVSFATKESMTVSVDVSQEDVVDLTIGDEVELVFTAYPDEVYKGIISSITTTATSEYATTISYPVSIHVQGDTSALYEGMTADVTFVTETREDVLYVSKKAIVDENGRKYVYVDEAGSKVLTEVTTGLSNGVNIEIVSGLSEGQAAYIASIVSTTEEESEEQNLSTGAFSEDNSGENALERNENMPNMGGNSMPMDPGAGGGFPQDMGGMR